MSDIYSRARDYFETEDNVSLRFKLLEIFSGGSVLQFTNQTEPSDAQQLSIIYSGLSPNAQANFVRSLTFAMKSCTNHSGVNVFDTISGLTTLAAEIQADECGSAIEDFLVNFSNPLDEDQYTYLSAIIPDFASLCIGSPQSHVPFKRLADARDWVRFLPALMSACCFLDKNNMHRYLNEYLPIIRSSSIELDLFDIVLEIEACAGNGSLFGQLQYLETHVLEDILAALFDGDVPLYSIQMGVDPAALKNLVDDRPGPVAVTNQLEAHEQVQEFQIPCDQAPQLFHALSYFVGGNQQVASANIFSLVERIG